MYLTGGHNVFALEPETGKALWKYTAPHPVSRRGVAYWPGDGTLPPRIFTGAGDRLMALDAKTRQAGRPSSPTADRSTWRSGIKGDVDGNISLASPPIDLPEHRSSPAATTASSSPASASTATSARGTPGPGKLLWTFHTVPRAGRARRRDVGRRELEEPIGYEHVVVLHGRRERGLLFAPIGSPTSDYYGGDRKGKNLYGNSVVALDANTGKLKWYQQLVHHDLWDFDLPAAPTLFDVKRNGRTIPAVGVITKMSTLFIFNRETGEPIYGMEERPVPAERRAR